MVREQAFATGRVGARANRVRLAGQCALAVTVAALVAGCDSGSPSSSPTTTTPILTTTIVEPSTTPAPTTTTLVPTSTAAPTTTPATTTTLPAATTLPATTTTLATLPPQTTQVLTGRYVTDPTDDIRLGDSGPAVLQIQARLGAWGYILPIDGSYGITTEQQVMAFQRDHGLKADGISGRNTWFALSAEPPG